MNLKSLSDRLGLSPTTVSRALGGYSDVSPATRERVQAAAREFGYQPHGAARRLARGRADAVGIVYPVDADFMGNPLFLQMVAGVSDCLSDAGVDVLMAVARGDRELRTYERLVSGRSVDGLIVAHTQVVDERVAYLRQIGFPFVGYGRTGDPAGWPWLDFDNESSWHEPVQRLKALGHRRIAYVHASLGFNFAHQRHLGFQRAMAEADLAVEPALVLAGALDRRGGYAAGCRLLAHDPRPTAVLVDNNLCGVGVVRSLIEAGLELGRDISVVVNDGIQDDTLLAGHQVAAVTQPTAHDAGRAMAGMLLELIEGRRPEPLQRLLPSRYVEAASVGPAADVGSRVSRRPSKP